ncbi:MAG: hypothetical protein ACI92S_004365 [Planctomycetaceae bacterium]
MHHPADSHWRRRRGNCIDDVIDGRRSQRKDGIHNLPLAPTQFEKLGHLGFLIENTHQSGSSFHVAGRRRYFFYAAIREPQRQLR